MKEEEEEDRSPGEGGEDVVRDEVVFHESRLG